MKSRPALPTRDVLAAPAAEAAPSDRFYVGLEPVNAWRLRGGHDEPDQIIIPGLLLDDCGDCSRIEASLDFDTFCKMQAMALFATSRMTAARLAALPSRTAAEANIWLLDGRTDGRALLVESLVALDRVAFLPNRQAVVETLTPAMLVPGEKAWL